MGLHLERAGDTLRLYNPLTGAWLLTPDERAEQERQRAELERERADRAEREIERLRREIEERKRRNGG